MQEVLYSPFVVIDEQRLPFIETEEEFAKAGEKIKKDWHSLLEAGLNIQIMLAEVTGKPQAFILVESDGDETNYTVQALGKTVDFSGLPVDLVRLTKSESNKNNPKANFVTVAIRSIPRPNIGQLVALDVQDEGKRIIRNKFHFVDGNLYAMHQVTRPFVLYPDLPGPDENQFFSVGFARLENQEHVLKVEAGVMYDQARAYWYKNIGGSLIRNRGLRINGKEAQVYEVSTDGNIYNSKSFLITEAITNVSNFEPATS